MDGAGSASRLDRRGVLLAGLALGLPTAVHASAPVVSSDPLWKTLETTKITEDRKSGLLSAAYPDAVRAFAGRTLTIEGFVLPVEATQSFRHFILTRYSPTCPFCPPGGANEVVEVWATQPIWETEELIRISGQFSLMNDAAKGLFFRMTAAKLV